MNPRAIPSCVVLAAVLGACGVSIPLPLRPPAAHEWFPSGRERVWIGPDFWANRLQDWRLTEGRAECVEGGDRFPLRTLNVLAASASPEPGELFLRVRTGAVTPFPAGTERGFRGFLVGAGGPGIDPRLSAQVHARPAEDGGILAVADARGRVALYDNSRPAPEGNTWTARGPLPEEALARLEPDLEEAGDLPPPGAPLFLELRARPFGEWYTLELSSRQIGSGARISRAVLHHVAPGQVDGVFGLVSHLGSPDGGGWWFSGLEMKGGKLEEHPERAWGPVLAAQFTVHRGELKLTAQFPPLGEGDPSEALLEIRPEGTRRWRGGARAPVEPDSWTAAFRVPDWDSSRGWEWRVRLAGDGRTLEGRVPAEPLREEEFVIAHLTGHKVYTGVLKWNHQGIWMPHKEIVAALRFHDPDLLFFSGDQIYEGDLDPADARNEDILILDYLYKWYRWCWAFGELTKEIPAVTTPDDHDVYHGNIWGAGGRRAHADPDRGISAQDSGGYKYGPRFVNAVHRTQTSHLPDPAHLGPVGDGYTTWYTDLLYGGISFAVLADRQFKSSPTVMVPEGKVVNGWFQNPDFDPAARADVPGAELLGAEQEAFLARWARDWSGGAWMKVVLSQTPFVNVATIPEGAKSGSVLPGQEIPEPGVPVEGDKLAADCDSNGWPQTPRRRAVAEFRRCFAVHLAGDQHLASLVQYGVDDFRDGGFVFATPSVANTWPRRWWPPMAGGNREDGAPPWTGDFRDGFGNPMTVWAVANPARSGLQPAALHDRMPGYGITRIHRKTREITFECWPRHADPSAPGARQYPGWPRTVHQAENGGEARGWLPGLEVEGPPDPVVELIRETDGELEYSLRIEGHYFWPMAHGEGPYTLRVIHPFTGQVWEARGLTPADRPEGTLHARW